MLADCLLLLLAPDAWPRLAPPPPAAEAADEAGAGQRRLLLQDAWTDWAPAVACERLCSLFERVPAPRAGRAWRDQLDPRLAHVQLPPELARQRSDLNRGACKLRGLDLSLGGALTAALGVLPENAALDLCGGPGGWLQALAAHRPHGTLFLGSTWTGSPTPNSGYDALLRAWGSEGGPDLTNVLLDQAAADDDTDLRRPEALARLRAAWGQQLRERDLPCTLVLGDGGAPEAADQERRGTCLLAAQLLLGTQFLAEHAPPAGAGRERALLVCKFFGGLCLATQLALAAAALAFDEWCVVKPVASRSANAEAYLACRGPAGAGERTARAERVLARLHRLGPAPAPGRVLEVAEEEHGVVGALLAFREQFRPYMAARLRVQLGCLAAYWRRARPQQAEVRFALEQQPRARKPRPEDERRLRDEWQARLARCAPLCLPAAASGTGARRRLLADPGLQARMTLPVLQALQGLRPTAPPDLNFLALLWAYVSAVRPAAAAAGEAAAVHVPAAAGSCAGWLWAGPEGCFLAPAPALPGPAGFVAARVPALDPAAVDEWAGRLAGQEACNARLHELLCRASLPLHDVALPPGTSLLVWGVPASKGSRLWVLDVLAWPWAQRAPLLGGPRAGRVQAWARHVLRCAAQAGRLLPAAAAGGGGGGEEVRGAQALEGLALPLRTPTAGGAAGGDADGGGGLWAEWAGAEVRGRLVPLGGGGGPPCALSPC